MAILSGQVPGFNLDSPPPLPDSTKSPAQPQSNLMTAGGLGEMGGSPQVMVLQAMAGIEQSAKVLSAFLPTTAAAVGDLLGRLRPVVAQALGQMTQGQPPQAGMPPGPPQAGEGMAPPPMAPSPQMQ